MPSCVLDDDARPPAVSMAPAVSAAGGGGGGGGEAWDRLGGHELMLSSDAANDEGAGIGPEIPIPIDFGPEIPVAFGGASAMAMADNSAATAVASQSACETMNRTDRTAGARDEEEEEALGERETTPPAVCLAGDAAPPAPALSSKPTTVASSGRVASSHLPSPMRDAWAQIRVREGIPTSSSAACSLAEFARRVDVAFATIDHNGDGQLSRAKLIIELRRAENAPLREMLRLPRRIQQARTCDRRKGCFHDFEVEVTWSSVCRLLLGSPARRRTSRAPRSSTCFNRWTAGCARRSRSRSGARFASRTRPPT